MKSKQNYFFVFVIFTAVFTACVSQSGVYRNLGAPTDAVPIMRDLRTGTLPNGLTYYIMQNAKPENRAFLSIAVKAGSVNETPDERGLAHFVEHMAFNGTERFPELQLLDYLRSLGMRFGADVNAYTSYDETVYTIETTTEITEGIKKIPEKALAIIDDWSRAILFTEKDVDEERAVILEEARARKGVWERARKELFPVLFHDSPYLDRDPIGKEEIIANAPPSMLKNFYEKWYKPENMAIIFTGDFDAQALENSLESHFGAVKSAGLFIRSVHDLAPPEKGRFAAKVISDSEFGAANIYFYYKSEMAEYSKTLSGYRDYLIMRLFLAALNTRFSELSLDPESPAAGIYAGEDRYGASSHLVNFSGTAKKDKIRETLNAMLTEKERALRYGFTQSEVELAKREIAGWLSEAAAEMGKRESSEIRDKITNHYLTGAFLPDADWEESAARELFKTIGAKDLHNALKKMLEYEDITVFIVSDGTENTPSENEIKKAFENIKKEKIARPVNKKIESSLLDYDPRPGEIVEEIIDESGAVIWTLSNGAKVIVQPTNNKNGEIILSASALGGYANVPEKEIISARLAPDILRVSGAGKYSITDLEKILAGKNVSFSLGTSLWERSVSGFSTTADIQTFFELLYLSWTEPRTDEKAIRAYLSRLKTYLENIKNSPDGFFFIEGLKLLYGNSPYFTQMEASDIDNVSIETTFNFALRSINPADWTFVFTGNIDADNFKYYIEKYIASLPNTPKGLNAQTRFNEIAQINVPRPSPGKIVLNKGKENRAAVYTTWFVPSEFSEISSLAINTLAEYLDIRLTEIAREKLGGVYTIYPSGDLMFFPPKELSLEIMFYCDPARVDELLGAVNAEVAAIAQGQIDKTIFEQAVLAQIKEWESNMEDNNYIASRYAAYSVTFGLPLSRLSERGDTLRSITSGMLRDSAQRLLSKQPVIIVLYPEV